MSYVICTSPRSGSTLLFKMLAATGIAGRPASYFFGPSLEDWLDDLGIAPEESSWERDRLEAAFRVARLKGSGSNGVFGLRLQGHSHGFFCEKLAVLHPEGATDRERFERAFGPTLFVHLMRRDKVDQAVSYLKARQTGLWHVAPDGTELERLAPHGEPRYDHDAIQACIDMMVGYDRGWTDWFVQEGIEPVRVSYDDLSADPNGTLRHVLECLGLEPTAADGVTPGVAKLADRVNRDWVARFRAEQGYA
ncbi:Stf0 family sulfotransferase [Chthonobacter rhizosphaerae]|uniref:Stf0 family sulfotransferase n=1 Tax=Chthonobacter rhizosphaerae TaxID=2735553 RepID=UPI001FE2E889|nr:Stf0 family sulfotransferase [Chthonobacter rhizosphaerae]